MALVTRKADILINGHKFNDFLHNNDVYASDERRYNSADPLVEMNAILRENDLKHVRVLNILESDEFPHMAVHLEFSTQVDEEDELKRKLSGPVPKDCLGREIRLGMKLVRTDGDLWQCVVTAIKGTKVFVNNGKNAVPKNTNLMIV
jgi:hypothetical protein